ncbi:hypothetical protein ACFLYY_01335 [Patescibacteria group bacterium]
MGNITKKIVAISIVLTLSVMVVPSAQGQTVAELQTLINSLTAQIAALSAQLAALTGGTTGGVTGCTITSFDTDLSEGSTGTDVKCLQIILNSSADTQLAATGVGSPGNETEYFGPLTAAAATKFQEKYASEVLTPIGLTSGTGYVGSKTRAKLNTMLASGTGTTTPTTPTGGPLTVSLAATTPAAGNLLKGEANKTVTSLLFCADAVANSQITNLTVQSYGTAALNSTDVSNVKVFDGTTQVGLTQSLISGLANFVFAPAISITAATCKVLNVAVDVATGATTLATVKMGVASSASIGGATFMGVFPVVGNSHNIVPGGSLGTLSVTAGPVVPSLTTRIGATDVVLGNFVISAGPNEDVDVTQFTVAATSTMLDTDVTNVRIKIDGVQMGNSASFSLRRATIDLTPAVRITKGTSKSVQVIGTITAGVGRIIEVGVQANNVFARGVISGAGLGGPTTAFYLSTPNQITIQRGALTIAVSTASPQGGTATLVKSVVAQTLGVYDIRAIGENVLINTITLAFNGAGTGTVNSVGLYDENGALISGLNDLAASSTTWGAAAYYVYSVNWTIMADTTKKLYIKGITNNVTGPDPASFAVQLNVGAGATTIVGTGMTSAGTEGANNVTSAATLALPAVSISQGPTFTGAASQSATPRNQAILSPISQATIATLRVTAQRENQTLRSLTLTGTTSAGALSDFYSGVAIFDGATQVTNFVVPGATTIVFGSGTIFTPVTFTQNVAKDLSIVANVLGSLNATTASTSIAQGNLMTAGVSSGQTATNSAISLTVNSGGLGANTGGILTAYTDVLEIAKSASSPSGNIGRATYDPTASWVLTHRGTDAAGVDVTSVTFTSLTGLAGIATDTATNLFRLYDDTNGQVLSTVGSTTINLTNNTVTFAMATNTLRVAPYVPRTVTLQVSTTNTTNFPTGSVLEWTINTAANITVIAGTGGAARGAGYGGTVWSIPAAGNQVTIP